MDIFIFSFLLVGCLVSTSRAAVVPSQRNTYDDFDSLEDNLVESEYDVPGMLPPKETAKDYYMYKNDKELPAELPSQQQNSKYVIDTVNKVLRLKDESATAETKLSQAEEEQIKKLSAAFLDLFTNAKLEDADWDTMTTSAGQGETSTDVIPEAEAAAWRKLNPVITFSDSGLTITFANSTENTTDTSSEESNTETVTDELRESLWTYLSQSIDKLLEDEVDRVSNSTEGSSDETIYITTAEPEGRDLTDKEEQSGVSQFVDSIWSLMKTSLDYVGSLFRSETPASSAEPTTEALSTSSEAPSTSSEVPSTSSEAATSSTEAPSTDGQIKFGSGSTTFFAFEEPSSYHRLPSHEFEKRGRDIDSILYGQGIV